MSKQREGWLEAYVDAFADGVTKEAVPGLRYCCSCCGYPTLDERGGFDICLLCNWEDDGQDDHNADRVLGGPNGDYSLAEARSNFEAHATSYRPADTRHFERTTRARAAKREICRRLTDARWKSAVTLTPEALAAFERLAKER
jgi:hypothetical protein